jgi:hypothetical protein
MIDMSVKLILCRYLWIDCWPPCLLLTKQDEHTLLRQKKHKFAYNHLSAPHLSRMLKEMLDLSNIKQNAIPSTCWRQILSCLLFQGFSHTVVLKEITVMASFTSCKGCTLNSYICHHAYINKHAEIFLESSHPVPINLNGRVHGY